MYGFNKPVIILTRNRFQAVYPVTIYFYVSRTYPDVTIGELRDFAQKYRAKQLKSPPKKKREDDLVDPARIGAWAASIHYGEKTVTRETKAYEAYVEREPYDGTMHALALYKKDKILIEVLGLR